MKQTASMIVLAAAMLVATPALAAGTTMKIEGIEGDAAVASWSFGVCNTGQCGTASTKRTRPAGSPEHGRESVASAGRVQAGMAQAGGALANGTGKAVGDVDGDGSPDLAFAANFGEVYVLQFTFQKIPGEYQLACATGHLDTVTVTSGSDVFEIKGAAVSCVAGAGSGAAAASYARSGINRIDSTPARMSTNFTTAKQSQGVDFGTRCQAGVACAATTMTFTGGQMKHTKTGHVTILK